MKIEDIPKLCVKEEIKYKEDGSYEVRFSLSDNGVESVIPEEAAEVVINHFNSIMTKLLNEVKK